MLIFTLNAYLTSCTTLQSCLCFAEAFHGPTALGLSVCLSLSSIGLLSAAGGGRRLCLGAGWPGYRQSCTAVGRMSWYSGMRRDCWAGRCQPYKHCRFDGTRCSSALSSEIGGTSTVHEGIGSLLL